MLFQIIRKLSVAVFLCLGTCVQAAVVEYSIAIDGENGASGFGIIAFNDAVTEDVYRDMQGGQCSTPVRYRCEYFGTLTPLTALELVFAGREFRGGYRSWVEGSLVYHRAGGWFDPNRIVAYSSDGPYIELDIFGVKDGLLGEYSFTSQGNGFYQSGTVTIAEAPLPAGGALLLIGLGAFRVLRRRKLCRGWSAA